MAFIRVTHAFDGRIRAMKLIHNMMTLKHNSERRLQLPEYGAV
jgi:two-component sensor histidine kinase